MEAEAGGLFLVVFCCLLLAWWQELNDNLNDR